MSNEHSSNPVSPDAAYSAIVHLVIHAESITWNRFYNFLMGNTLLILAWATLFASSSSATARARVAQAALCVLGVGSGPLWAAMSVRGRKYLFEFVALGSAIEANPAAWPSSLPPGPLSRAANIRDTHAYAWAGSYYVLPVSSLAFSALYVVLITISVGPVIGIGLSAATLVVAWLAWTVYNAIQQRRQKNIQSAA